MLMKRFKIWLNTPTYRGMLAKEVQKFWRGYVCAKRYHRQRAAVLRIQAVWRGSQVPTRSRRGAFNVKYLFSHPRIVIEDDDGRLTKLAPYGSQAAGIKQEVVDLRKISIRQRRLLYQYVRCVLDFTGFVPQVET
jgi:hypothetical protein